MANRSKAAAKKPKLSVKYAPRPITAPSPAVVIARSLLDSPTSSPVSPSIVVVNCASAVSAAFSALQKCDVIAVDLQTAKCENVENPFGTAFKRVPKRLILAGVSLSNPHAREKIPLYGTTAAPPPSRPQVVFVLDLGAILPDCGGILSDGLGPLLTNPDVVLIGLKNVRKNLRLFAQVHMHSVPCLEGYVSGVRLHKEKKAKPVPVEVGLQSLEKFCESARQADANISDVVVFGVYDVAFALCVYVYGGQKGGHVRQQRSPQRFELWKMWVWKCRTCNFHILEWDDVYSCPSGCHRHDADFPVTSDPFVFMVRECIGVDGDEGRFVEQDAFRRSTLQNKVAQKKVAEEKKTTKGKKGTHRKGGEALDPTLLLETADGKEKGRAKRSKKDSVLKATKSLRRETEREKAYREKVEASRMSSKHHSKKAAETFETAKAQHRKNCVQKSKKDPKLKWKTKSEKKKNRRKAMARNSTAARNMKIDKLSIRDVNNIIE